MKIQAPPPSHAHAADSVREAKERLRAFARESAASRPGLQTIIVRLGVVAAASAVAASAISRLLPVRRGAAPGPSGSSSEMRAGRGLLSGAFWPVLLRSAQVAAPLVITAIGRARRTGQGAQHA